MIRQYYMPTRVIMGPDCIMSNCSLFRTLGKKALIVTGTRSAKQNGSEEDVKMALEAAGVSYRVFDKVMSNPTISCVYEGASAARESKADFVIAIGGGSPMDAGKAIALLAAQDIAEEDLFSGLYGNKVLPMAFVPTTAGTGSEVTQYSILTNDNAQTKTSIASSLLFPAVAFLDPKYLEHLPVTTTVNTAIDALSHAVEGMLSVRASALSDALAVESIRLIMECMPELVKVLETAKEAPLDLKIRERLLQASLMAGMVIAQTGTTVVHAMGYSLTYFKDVDHGRANGLLLGEYLELVEREQPELTDRVLKAMGLSGIKAFKALMDCLLGGKEAVSAEEIRKYSGMAIQTRNIGNCVVKPMEDEIEEMYRAVFVK